MWLRKFILGVGFSKALGRNDPIGREKFLMKEIVLIPIVAIKKLL